MNSSLKLFTQSDILHQIGVGPLQKFLNQFTDSDSWLSSLDSDSPYLCSELARLFTQAQSLSPRVREVLLLLESAASHENYDQVSAIAQQRLPNLCVTEFHPLALALELWLAFPDDFSQFINEQHDSQEPVGTHSTASHSSGDISDAVERVPTTHLQSNNSSSSVQCPESGLPYPASSIENPASDLSSIENQDGRTSLVNGRTSLVDSLRSLLTRYVILPQHAAEALALWIVHTYAFELRDVTTYLGLESPVRRCGKSTLLTVLSRLVNRPLVAANVSPSALYRAIEELRPTLMIDEADTFLKSNDELTGILNAGYYKPTAFVLRVASERSSGQGRIHVSEPNSAPDESTNQQAAPTEVENLRSDRSFRDVAPTELERRLRDGGYRDGAPTELLRSRNGSTACARRKEARIAPDRVDSHSAFSSSSSLDTRHSSLARFSCWCPKIIARIGRLPETLADRCIVIRMQRKTPNDQCERLRDLDMVAVRKDLRQECAQFVEQHREAIATAKPAIPAALNDRAADIWEPLLALADCAGGDWPALARGAALALSSDTRENNPIGSLLLDIFLLFATSGQDRLPTRALIDALNSQFTDRPWMETRKGQRSTEMWLSEQLRPFGINPRTFRQQNSILRGYHREDFDEAFRRYIPQSEMDTFRALTEKNIAQTTPDEQPASGTHQDQR